MKKSNDDKEEDVPVVSEDDVGGARLATVTDRWDRDSETRVQGQRLGLRALQRRT